MKKLTGRTAFITGASRGIGRSIAEKWLQDGANVAMLARTKTPDPRLDNETIYTAAAELAALGFIALPPIECDEPCVQAFAAKVAAAIRAFAAAGASGGVVLPIVCDVRKEEEVARAISATAQVFGGIDYVVNNVSALAPTGTEDTTIKSFDLMLSCNARATFMTSKLALPHLKASAAKGNNPHILTLSPPLKNLNAGWLKPHLAYTFAKFGMTIVTTGLAAEFAEDGIAANCLWPETTIATKAVENMPGGKGIVRRSRKPEIVAIAAHAIVTRPSTVTGQCFTDVQVLNEEGITNLDEFAVDPAHAHELIPDIFLGEAEGHPFEVMHRMLVQKAKAAKAAAANGGAGAGEGQR
jgi:citronellol/citronellal dehydrogenase